MDRVKFYLNLAFVILGIPILVFSVQYPNPNNWSDPSVVDLASAGKTASLSLVAPSVTGAIPIKTTTTLQVRIDDGGSKVGMVKAGIFYSSNLVKINSVSFGNTFCSISTDSAIDEKTGYIQLHCTANEPGLTTQIGTVATISLETLAAGNASFQFDDGISSVSSRPSNREVLGSLNELNLQIGNSNQNGQVVVASMSHPSGISCSPKATAELAWLKVADAVRYEYSWSESLITAEPNLPTTGTFVALPTKAGAQQFFAIRSVNSKGVKSATTIYRVVSCP